MNDDLVDPRLGFLVGLAEQLGAEIHADDPKTSWRLVVERVQRDPDRVHLIRMRLPGDQEPRALVDVRYEGDASWFTGLVRAVIVVPTASDLRAMVSELIELVRANGFELAWGLDRTAREEASAVSRGPTEVGYRDCVLNMRGEDGFISELCLEVAAMWLARAKLEVAESCPSRRRPSNARRWWWDASSASTRRARPRRYASEPATSTKRHGNEPRDLRARALSDVPVLPGD